MLIILTGLFGCNNPTELSVSDNTKPADKFARNFIDKIISGQLDRAYRDIEPGILNDKATETLANISKNINGAIPKKYKVVEAGWTSSYMPQIGKITIYKLGYEYEFEKGYVLFTTAIKEKDGKLSVYSFNGDFLQAPLAELTKFTFSGKNPLQYLIFVLCCLVPLFIITTLIVMLLSTMTTKKKIIWSLIILLVAFPRFVMNWNNGAMDFNLLYLSLFGSSIGQPTLYSAWLVSFNIPIGAILFWVKRERLLPEDDEDEVSADDAETTKAITNE